MALAMSSIAVALQATYLRGLDAPELGLSLPWVLLWAGFLASETFVIILPLKKEAHSISATEGALLFGLLFYSPSEIVLAYLAAVFVVSGLREKQPVLKQVFNLALASLTPTLASVTFHLLAPAGDELTAVVSGAALAGVAVSAVTASVAVSLVIKLYEPQGKTAFATPLLYGLGLGMGMALYALIGALAVLQGRWSGLLFSGLTLLLLFGLKRYSLLLQAHANLEMLWGFSLDVGEASGRGVIAKTIAEQIRRTTRAELVLVHLDPRGSQKKVVAISSESSDAPDVRTAELTPYVKESINRSRSLLMKRNSRDPEHVAFLSERGLRDAIVSPIRLEGETLGWVLVANKPGTASTYTIDDARLVETLAFHVALSVERGQLVENLQVEAARNDHMARHDELTELENRRHFSDKLADRVSRSGSSMAILIVDLDHFKEINDTLGHAAGDEVLIHVAERLKIAFRVDTYMARLGGDEFAVAIPDISTEMAVKLSKRVLKVMTTPIDVRGVSVDVGCCVGIAMYPDHGDTPDTVLQRADVALAHAKRSRGASAVYDPQQDESSAERLALVTDLRRAIESGGIDVHYQPKIRLRDGVAVGAEALARWTHPVHGPISPDVFIGLAEHTGLIGPLTKLVLARSLRDCAQWRKMNPTMTVAVNLSARSLIDTSVPEQVAAALARENLDPDALRLEITESAIMSDPHRAGIVIKHLSEMGVTLSIDDFGTGYTSFAYLRDLPVDELKVDKSFVMTMRHDERNLFIVRAIMDLACSLSLDAVAEGVEDRATAELLREMGCKQAQGYHFAAPMPGNDLLERFASASVPDAHNAESAAPARL